MLTSVIEAVPVPTLTNSAAVAVAEVQVVAGHCFDHQALFLMSDGYQE